MSSKITTDLAVDPALVMDANYRLNNPDRRYIDDQIRGIEQHLVDMLIVGRHGSWFDLDGSSAAVIAGDTVCLAGGNGTVTKTTPAAIANAAAVLGVVVQAAPSGGKVFVAFSGILPPSITGLAAAAGLVRVNTVTSRLQRVGTLFPGDIGIGVVDATGWLQCGINSSGGYATITYALAADFTTTLATAVSTNLSFPVLAGESWQFEFKTTAFCSAAGGTKFAIDAPLASTIESWVESSTTTVTSVFRQRVVAISTLIANPTHTAVSVPAPDKIWGVVTAGANGFVTLQVASVTAGQTSTVKAGGSIRASRASLV